jgi:hypothetical protein
MPVTYDPKRTAARQRPDGRWEVSTKTDQKNDQGAPVYRPPAGVAHCTHDGHETAEEAESCWAEFLAKQDAVYTV